MDDFIKELTAVAQTTEGVLSELLPKGKNNPIVTPIRHAALNGGKRLRAFMAVQSASLYDIKAAEALRTGAAIECMHAYSLVHDDLPCMDDDDMRRGKPTVHVKWDEATAVLTGDALQTLAFEILADPKTSPNAEVRVRHSLRFRRIARRSPDRLCSTPRAAKVLSEGHADHRHLFAQHSRSRAPARI